MLRSLFGFLRVMTVLLAVFWLFLTLFGPWLTNRFQSRPNLVVSLGDVSLPSNPGAMELKSDTARPGALALKSLRGTLEVDIGSNDAGLVRAVRLALIPALVIFAAFSWILFSALRNVCANIALGDVFSERNLRLVRGIGVTLIVYSLAGGLVWMWGSYVFSDYLARHVVLTGISSGLQWPVGSLFFNLSPGALTSPGGLVTGCLVLVVAEAFRQGLNLKTENDLTV